MSTTETYLPATFEDRGVSVSFTTPALAFCRLRKDYRDRLEVVVPALSESKGFYVIPWSSLQDSIALTVHDRALQEEVERMKAVSPHDIRVAELTIAANGLAGTEAGDAAIQTLEREREYVKLTHLMLMVKVLMATDGMTPEMKACIARGEADEVIRQGAAKVAKGFGLLPTQLDQRLVKLSAIVAPLGIEDAPEKGRLRILVDELNGFRTSLARWATDNLVQETELAPMCFEVSGLTLDRANAVIGTFDGMIREPVESLRNWDTALAEIHSGIVRLSWLIDGWEKIVQAWDEAIVQRLVRPETALVKIYQALPLLPKSEFKETDTSQNYFSRITTKRRVRMYEDWSTGQLDMDTLSRIESAKAQQV